MRKRRKKQIWVVILFVLIIGGVILAPKIKHRLTAQPTYDAQTGEYVPAAHKGTTTGIFKPGTKAILPTTKWVPQSFNNCVPATTSMVLGYFGYTVDQTVTKAALRTNEDDKNVFTYEMQAYLKQYDIESKLLFNGDREILKKLIANGFYVVVEDYLHPHEDIGHVTIIRGFDDTRGVFIADDSYLGNNITYKYDVFEREQWKPFNREYLPVYRAEQEEKVKEIIGENWNTKTMYEHAVTQAQKEIADNDKDMYAYFNLGTSYYGLKEYAKADAAFKKSQALGWPKRLLWYQIQPVQNLNALKKYEEALTLADLGLWSNDSFAELHVEKAKAYKGLGQTQKAEEERQKALKYAPGLQI